MKLKIIVLILSLILIINLSLFIAPTIIDPFTLNELDKNIISLIRLPRVITAILIGMALGVSGALLQGILRNPIADPYILGMSSGASFMAVLSFVFGLSEIIMVSVPILSFIGAISTGLIVSLISYRKGYLWREMLLLSGVGIGFLFSALLMLVLLMSSNEGVRRYMLWFFGDISSADWILLCWTSIFIAIGFVIALVKTKSLNALMLGDEVAWSLGFNPSKERLYLFIGSAFMIGASVSLGGIIGFVGLIVPHIVRFYTTSNKYLLPLCAITGAMVLLIADLIGKSVVYPTEIPAGVISALIGAPYFLWLLKKENIF